MQQRLQSSSSSAPAVPTAAAAVVVVVFVPVQSAEGLAPAEVLTERAQKSLQAAALAQIARCRPSPAADLLRGLVAAHGRHVVADLDALAGLVVRSPEPLEPLQQPQQQTGEALARAAAAAGPRGSLRSLCSGPTEEQASTALQRCAHGHCGQPPAPLSAAAAAAGTPGHRLQPLQHREGPCGGRGLRFGRFGLDGESAESAEPSQGLLGRPDAGAAAGRTGAALAVVAAVAACGAEGRRGGQGPQRRTGGCGPAGCRRGDADPVVHARLDSVQRFARGPAAAAAVAAAAAAAARTRRPAACSAVVAVVAVLGALPRAAAAAAVAVVRASSASLVVLLVADYSRPRVVRYVAPPRLGTPPRAPRLSRKQRHVLDIPPPARPPSEAPAVAAARARARADELLRAWGPSGGAITATEAWSVLEQTTNCSRLMRLLADAGAGGVLFNRLAGRAGLTPGQAAASLSAEGNRMRLTPNAGGNSVWSEVLSYELLRAAYGARLLRTEMEIEYACDSKITDYSVRLRGRSIGVSVTRVINFADIAGHKHQAEFSAADVRRLLEKKLYGVIASSAQVTDAHRWEKQVLHVFTTSPLVSRTVVEQFWQVREDLRADTVVVVTQCSNVDWIF
eukprot:m51a1_g9931 putative protein (622) ;mRNA; r:52510-55487